MKLPGMSYQDEAWGATLKTATAVVLYALENGGAASPQAFLARAKRKPRYRERIENWRGESSASLAFDLVVAVATFTQRDYEMLKDTPDASKLNDGLRFFDEFAGLQNPTYTTVKRKLEDVRDALDLRSFRAELPDFLPQWQQFEREFTEKHGVKKARDCFSLTMNMLKQLRRIDKALNPDEQYEHLPDVRSVLLEWDLPHPQVRFSYLDWASELLAETLKTGTVCWPVERLRKGIDPIQAPWLHRWFNSYSGYTGKKSPLKSSRNPISEALIDWAITIFDDKEGPFPSYQTPLVGVESDEVLNALRSGGVLANGSRPSRLKQSPGEAQDGAAAGERNASPESEEEFDSEEPDETGLAAESDDTPTQEEFVEPDDEDANQSDKPSLDEMGLRQLVRPLQNMPRPIVLGLMFRAGLHWDLSRLMEDLLRDWGWHPVLDDWTDARLAQELEKIEGQPFSVNDFCRRLDEAQKAYPALVYQTLFEVGNED